MNHSHNPDLTIQTWNNLAQTYQDKFMHLDVYDDSYNDFCSMVETQNASVLELGCGPGNITHYLLKKRPDFSVLATDAAPNMVELAQKNNPAAKCSVLDCRAISTLTKKFDAIVCGFCLPYLSHTESAKLIADCSAALNDDGVFYLSFIEGDYAASQQQTSSDGKHTMQVYYYNHKDMKTLLTQQGFYAINTHQINYPKGTITEVHTMLVAKKSSL